MYSLYQENKVTKKVYNNKINTIKLENRKDAIFMNSEKVKLPILSIRDYYSIFQIK